MNRRPATIEVYLALLGQTVTGTGVLDPISLEKNESVFILLYLLVTYLLMGFGIDCSSGSCSSF